MYEKLVFQTDSIVKKSMALESFVVGRIAV